MRGEQEEEQVMGKQESKGNVFTRPLPRWVGVVVLGLLLGLVLVGVAGRQIHGNQCKAEAQGWGEVQRALGGAPSPEDVEAARELCE